MQIIRKGIRLWSLSLAKKCLNTNSVIQYVLLKMQLQHIKNVVGFSSMVLTCIGPSFNSVF